MTNSPIYFDTADVVIPVTPPVFVNGNNMAVTPDSVTCVVTDPEENSTTYTYGSGEPGDLNAVYQVSTGKYELDLQPFSVETPPPPGLWHTTWVGSGGGVANSVQVNTTSFRVMGLSTLAGQNNFYCGLEELKSRLGVANSVTADDYEMTMAIKIATAYINRYCGTHFFRVTEARTFPVTNIYFLPIDQVVPGSITSFRIDVDGDGVFETPWTEGTNYQVYREGATYNQNYAGVDRPFDFVKVIMGTGPAGGQFFPFVWPFTHDDRVQITATWGWKEIPPEVQHAALLLSVQLFKEKDSPWGVVGMSDLGAVRVQQSPWIVDLLRPFKNPRKTVGV